MADDTAALVLSLEARFDKFEKAMNDAVTVVDRSSKKIEARFDQMTSVISEKLGAIQGSLVNRLGLAGELLTKLGPAGIGAAVGFGVLALAVKEAADAILGFGENMKKLRDLALLTGLSTDALQALRKATVAVGADMDQVVGGVERFVRAWEELRQGSGDLRTQLLRLNPALEKQLELAKDETEAVQILQKSFQGLTAAQAQLLGRAAFGRTSQDAIRLFRQGFDLTTLTQQLRESGKLIDEGIVQKTADEFDKLQANMKSFGSSIKNSILSWISPEALKTANEWLDWAKSWTDTWSKFTPTTRTDLANLPRITVFGATSTGQKPAAQTQTAGAAAAAERERIQFLAGAATATEKLKAQELELAAAVEKNKNLAPLYARALADVREQSEKAALAAREQVGVASEMEIAARGVIEVIRLRNEGIIKSDEELARAEDLVFKKAKETFENLQVAASKFPGLTRLALDANNAAKQIDAFATTSINQFVDSMADAVTGTKNLADAFRDMTASILKDLARLIIRQALVGPLLSSFGLGVPAGRMAGGPVTAGMPFMVGEGGPELFVPATAGVIVPNHALAAANGGTVIKGGDTQINVAGSADQGTVAAMQAMLAARDRRFIADVANATRELRRRSAFA